MAIGAGEDAGLALGQIGAVEVGLLPRLFDIGFDCRPLLVGRHLGHQRVLGGEDAVGGAKEGVGTGREDREVLVAAVDPEDHVGAVALADPVALHLLDALRPVDQIEVVEQALGVLGDLEHPLPHQAPLDRVSGLDIGAVLDLLVGEHGAQGRTPVDRDVRHVGEALFIELEEDPLRPTVVVRRRRY